MVGGLIKMHGYWQPVLDRNVMIGHSVESYLTNLVHFTDKL